MSDIWYLSCNDSCLRKMHFFQRSNQHKAWAALFSILRKHRFDRNPSKYRNVFRQEVKKFSSAVALYNSDPFVHFYCVVEDNFPKFIIAEPLHDYYKENLVLYAVRRGESRVDDPDLLKQLVEYDSDIPRGF